MRRVLGLAVSLVAAVLVLVALANRIQRPAEGPSFDLVGFFQTPTTGEGTIRALDLSVDRFAVSTTGFRENGAGRMLERFAHRDGRRRLQDWTLRFLNGVDRSDGYVATRPDLKGPSIFRPLGDDGYTYTWHQWLEPETRSDLVVVRGFLRLLPDGTLLNRAVAFKAFVPVAVVRVAFRPEAG